jgi:hypothetical protein
VRRYLYLLVGASNHTINKLFIRFYRSTHSNQALGGLLNGGHHETMSLHHVPPWQGRDCGFESRRAARRGSYEVKVAKMVQQRSLTTTLLRLTTSNLDVHRWLHSSASCLANPLSLSIGLCRSSSNLTISQHVGPTHDDPRRAGSVLQNPEHSQQTIFISEV